MALEIISRDELLEAANAFFPVGLEVTAEDKPGQTGYVVYNEAFTYPGDLTPSVLTWVSWPDDDSEENAGYDPACIKPVLSHI